MALLSILGLGEKMSGPPCPIGASPHPWGVAWSSPGWSRTTLLPQVSWGPVKSSMGDPPARLGTVSPWVFEQLMASQQEMSACRGRTTEAFGPGAPGYPGEASRAPQLCCWQPEKVTCMPLPTLPTTGKKRA